MGKQKTTKEFIINARQVHGNAYDYSKTKYNKALTKVIITCPIHGDFEQTPNSHLHGRGCPQCGKEKAKIKIKQTCQQKDYSKIKFTNKQKNIDEFIGECKQKHNSKYDYSKVVYKNNHTKVIITCPIHGDFEQTPSNHLQGQGCPQCAQLRRIEKKRQNQNDFIRKANYIHCNFYAYDKVVYKTAKTKVIITCPIHGDFEQTPDNHLRGSGCPNCQNSILEQKVRRALIDNNIQFISFYRPKWLKCDDSFHTQSLDFYIPEHNVAIECQGIQHFECNTDNFGSKTKTAQELFKITNNNDKRKHQLCAQQGISILYYTEIKNVDYMFDLITNIDELIQKIVCL